MPWKDKTVEELRKEFAESARTAKNFSRLCQEFGITRSTGYKWVSRYERQESHLTEAMRRKACREGLPMTFKRQF